MNEGGKEYRVKIAKLPPERWKEFKRLRLRSLRSDPISFGSSYGEEVTLGEEAWKSRMRNVLFALRDDKPVGMITLVLRKSEKNHHTADIFAVYVNKSYRRKGLGDKLLKRAISLIRENDQIVKIALNVTAEQTAAVNLYLKNRFKVVGVLEKEIRVNGNFYDELVMERLMQ